LLAALAFLTADQLQTRGDSSAAAGVAGGQVYGVVPVDVHLKRLAASTWPEDRTAALLILHCESRTGVDPDAWRLDAPDGGPFQINRASWEKYFLERYGWTWAQITQDPAINTAAARIIYDRTGDWSAWSCAQQLTSLAIQD
jgi:hypothetical protein